MRMGKAAWLMLCLGAMAGCATGSGSENGSGSWDDPASAVRVDGPWGDVARTSSWLDAGTATRRGIAADDHDVWSVLELAYGRLEIPVSRVSAIDSEIHTVGAWVRRFGDTRLSFFFDCGTDRFGPYADQYDVRLNLRAAVRGRADGDTDLVLDLDASAQPRGGVGEPVPCASRGRLEDDLRREVESMLGIGVGLPD